MPHPQPLPAWPSPGVPHVRARPEMLANDDVAVTFSCGHCHDETRRVYCCSRGGKQGLAIYVTQHAGCAP